MCLHHVYELAQQNLTLHIYIMCLASVESSLTVQLLFTAVFVLLFSLLRILKYFFRRLCNTEMDYFCII